MCVHITGRLTIIYNVLNSHQLQTGKALRMNEISGLTLRDVEGKGPAVLPTQLLIMSPIPVEGVGQVTHCRIMDRYLSSEAISELLLLR